MNYQARDPDVVISVHPLCSHTPLRVMERASKATHTKRAAFLNVVTDLGSAHPVWFHKDVDKLFVPRCVSQKEK